MFAREKTHADFKERHTLEQRIAMSGAMRLKYPSRVPLVVQQSPGGRLDHISQEKYLVPGETTIAQIIYIIRRRIDLAPEQALFVFMGRQIPPASDLIKDVYKREADPDGLLYITYSGESTFGGRAKT